MKLNRARIVAFAVGTSFLMGAVWFAVVRPHALLPTYGGKTVEVWFFGPDGHPGKETTMNAARVAFDAMGTNCVPYLLDTLRKRESAFHRFYCWVYPNLPAVIKSKLKPPLKPYYTHAIALWHLRKMGEKLDYAANDLMTIVPALSDDNTRRNASSLTEGLVVRLKDAGKKNAYFTGLLGDSDFRIQLNSAITLSEVDDSVTNGIPILINAITNSSLVDSTVKSPLASGKFSETAMLQRRAYKALTKVAPSIAAEYRKVEW
jgi:hypothetical protein